jgi:hypothetical protein
VAMWDDVVSLEGNGGDGGFVAGEVAMARE